MRKTKIICTLGPSTDKGDVLRDLIANGMNVARFNFSHGSYEEHGGRLAKLKALREELGKLISQQTEAYILDKAGELGLEVTVRVETRTEGNGIPVPWSAELTGSWSQALASALETELGIPAERQVWHEREAEN